MLSTTPIPSSEAFQSAAATQNARKVPKTDNLNFSNSVQHRRKPFRVVLGGEANSWQEEYMDLGWSAQTFAPDSYMMQIENIVVDNPGGQANLRASSVAVEFRDLVEPFVSTKGKIGKQTTILPPVDQVYIDNSGALFTRGTSTGDIGYTLSHSTPCFNFSWKVTAEYNTTPTDPPGVQLVLLFYPNPYFDQRY